MRASLRHELLDSASLRDHQAGQLIEAARAAEARARSLRGEARDLQDEARMLRELVEKRSA